MKSSSLIGGLVLVVFLTSLATAQSATIPLDEIWGYNLPGTRDIRGIPFPEQQHGIGQTFAFLNQQRDYNIEQIRLALAMKPPGEKASPGFVVSAQPDSRMLMAVYAHVRGKPNPFRNYPEGEYTLVFFSHPLSYYARLREVKREGNEITVLYQFEPHTTPEATAHFAMIPLGKLTAGEYHVDYRQIPLDEKYREMGFEPVHPEAAEFISRDFSFTVAEPLKEQPPTEGATMIPLDQVWSNQMPRTRNVRELEPDSKIVTGEELRRKSLSVQIERLLVNRGMKREKAGSAFVVVGTDKEALENAHAVFVEQGEPKQSFSTADDLSLIFYSYMSGGHYVHLDSIEQTEGKLMVKYRFVFHLTGDATTHFAIIPLGKLPAGTFQVEIKQLPTKLPKVAVPSNRDPTWLVCGDTSFRVKGVEP
jgi:hypothetical protein